jgi:hypothetical protein
MTMESSQPFISVQAVSSNDGKKGAVVYVTHALDVGAHNVLITLLGNAELIDPHISFANGLDDLDSVFDGLWDMNTFALETMLS